MYKINLKNVLWVVLSVIAGIIFNTAGLIFLDNTLACPLPVVFTVLLAVFPLLNRFIWQIKKNSTLFALSLLNVAIFAVILLTSRFFIPYIANTRITLFSEASILEIIIGAGLSFISIRMMLKKRPKTAEGHDFQANANKITENIYSEQKSNDKNKDIVKNKPLIENPTSNIASKALKDDVFEKKTNDNFQPVKNFNPVILKKKVPESDDGKLSTVGKLLVNHRDLENIIETNALLQHLSGNPVGMGLISLHEGEKLENSISALLKENSSIKDIFIMNTSGIPVYSTIKAPSKLQTICAMYSSVFAAAEIHLSQLNISNIQTMVLETNETSVFIGKHKDRYTVSLNEPDFFPVNYSSVRDLLFNDSVLNENPETLKNQKNLEEIIISDTSGKLLKSGYSDDLQKASKLSPLIIENLNSLLGDILNGQLKRLFIFTRDNVVIISKTNDKIVTLISKTGLTVKLSENSAKILQILNQG